MKFITLLTKELKELLTVQTIALMVGIVAIMLFLGDVMGNKINEAMDVTGTSVNICDEDGSDFTKAVIEGIESLGYTVNRVSPTASEPNQMLEELSADSLIIIPSGFAQTVLEDNKQVEIKYISRMKSTAMLSSISSLSASSAVEIIRSSVTNTLMTERFKLTDDQVTLLNEPVSLNEITVVADKSAEISSASLQNFVMSQGVIVPILVYVLVMFASQMIISAISTEKIDKTLETLLSAPVSRLSVLGAKMVAAAIVALLNAAAYMVGFSKLMTGTSSTEIAQDAIGETVSSADKLAALGLSMTMGDYILLGLQLFMTIMIALSVSLILGAMATDAKSTQTLMMPVTFATMIPYLISLFMDINQMEPIVARLAIWAIPFTHTFTAINNILFHNTSIYVGGLIYQTIFFIICMFFAVKLFTSDKIFTISLNIGQKRKFKKGRKQED